MIVDLTENLAKCATDNAEKGDLLDSVADRSEARPLARPLVASSAG